ncbi:hypothetical protein Nmel_017066 [Mimus melanotis]
MQSKKRRGIKPQVTGTAYDCTRSALLCSCQGKALTFLLFSKLISPPWKRKR